jgi:hypothetical protein
VARRTPSIRAGDGTLDGVLPAPILRANLAFRAVRGLPRAEHRIEMVYRPRAPLGRLAVLGDGLVIALGAARATGPHVSRLRPSSRTRSGELAQKEKGPGEPGPLRTNVESAN